MTAIIASPQHLLSQIVSLLLALALLARAATDPGAPVNPDGIVNGLKYKYYEGDWPDGIPDLSGVSPDKVGWCRNLDISYADRGDNYIITWHGYLKVPAAKDYWFTLRSDDGSRLYLNDQCIIKNDGADYVGWDHDNHRPHDAGSGAVSLSAGIYKATIMFHEVSGGEQMSLVWTADGMDPHAVPDSAWFQDSTGTGIVPRRGITDWRAKLPEPIMAGHDGWVDFYYDAWRIGDKRKYRSPKGWIWDCAHSTGSQWQWDMTFVTTWAKYCRDAHPDVTSHLTGLDLFYEEQKYHDDGFIPFMWGPCLGGCSNRNVQNPIFTLAEWDNYLFTADTARLEEVLPILDDFFFCVKEHWAAPCGVYKAGYLHNGMDNRPVFNHQAIIDLTGQQAMNALTLMRMAQVTGDSEREAKFQSEYNQLKELINTSMWDDATNFYCDVLGDTPDTTQITNWCDSKLQTWSVASFWPLIAEVADETKAEYCVQHLEDPDNFKTHHRVPSLGKRNLECSNSQARQYKEGGNYWQGSVWIPTNTMVIKGLRKYGYGDVALDIAMNHMESMYQTWLKRGTIYECYWQNGDDYPQEGGRLPDFVGWSGTTPIATFIEQIIGITVNAPKNMITWRVRTTEQHGLRDLRWGRDLKNSVSLVAAERDAGTDDIIINVTSNRAFTLKVDAPVGVHEADVVAGTQSFRVTSEGIEISDVVARIDGRRARTSSRMGVQRTADRYLVHVAGMSGSHTLRVLTLGGRTVAHQRATGGATYNIPRAMLSPGVYLLSVKGRGTVLRTRLVAY
ncbi:MAG: hypothetical protein GF418_13420 [Chitinivibrionales bacterium]|nr:hypothetical protein [Chitinivibrionales bacterium]MBD3396619.1 hypothetical protein [Chitinivibrionales bacterium]